MKNFLVSALSLLAPLAVSQISSADQTFQPNATSATQWYYTVSVDPHWNHATVYYYNDARDVWSYTLPCSSVAYGYQCSAVTAWGAPVVYSYYATTTYSYVTVSDTVYHCYTGVCY